MFFVSEVDPHNRTRTYSSHGLSLTFSDNMKRRLGGEKPFEVWFVARMDEGLTGKFTVAEGEEGPQIEAGGRRWIATWGGNWQFEEDGRGDGGRPADQEWSGSKRQTTWKTGPLSLVFGDKEQHIVGHRIFQEWWLMATEEGYEGEAKTSFNIEGKVVITLGKWQWAIEKDEGGWKIDGPSAVQNFSEKALTSSGKLQPSFDFTKKEELTMGWTTKMTDTYKYAVDEQLKRVEVGDYIPAEAFFQKYGPLAGWTNIERLNNGRFDSSKPNVANTPKRWDGTTGAEKVEQAPAGPTYTISIPVTPGPTKIVDCEATRKFNLSDKLLEIKEHENFNVRFAKDKTEYSLGKLVVFRTEIGEDEVETYSDVQQNVFLWLLRAGREGTYKMKFDKTHGWAEKVVGVAEKVETPSYQPEMPVMFTTPELPVSADWVSADEWEATSKGFSTVAKWNGTSVEVEPYIGVVADYLWANQIEGHWTLRRNRHNKTVFGVEVPGVVGERRSFWEGSAPITKTIKKETPLFMVGSLCSAELMDAAKMWDSTNSQLVDKKVAVKARNYEMNQAKLLLNYLNAEGLEGEWQLIVGGGAFWGEQYE